jgi:hypothetical protein
MRFPNSVGGQIALFATMLIGGGLMFALIHVYDVNARSAAATGSTSSSRQVEGAKSDTFCVELRRLVDRLADTLLIEAQAGKEPSDNNSRTLANAILDAPQCFNASEESNATKMLEVVNAR